MLTAANVSSEMAVNYFVKNYYHQGKSRWSGQGAEKLGLSGAIDNEQEFTNVIEGRSPQGSEQLNARVLKPKERRAALDCTFSAPKSVSLMALVGGDTRLINAHHQALKQVLQLIEQRYAYTRVTDDNNRHRVKTGNLVVAQFDHIESRELDPHLHTHCLLMNMTQTPDGRWLSLGNNEIFANKKFLGMAYQSYLAAEVRKLGYEVEPRQHGQFEIKGFKQQDLEAFSKRRQQIIATSGVNSTWAERNQVWDNTRKRKEKVTESELKSLWQQEAAALGITFVKPGEPRQDIPVNDLSLADALNDAFVLDVGAAIAHCSERNVAFTQEDLEKFILEERLATDLRAIEPLIREHQELIVLPGLERQYTTWAAVKREIATIALMSDGQGKVNPMLHPEVVESQLEKTSLNIGQRQAVQLAATTSDQFIAWQGVAGAGKTFALSQLKTLATDAGYTIKGFAPSSAAAKVLSQELEVQSETVARLLVTEPPPEVKPNQVWIVDEAGLLSAKDAYALLQRATQEQARVIFVGDTRQMSAVEAGNPFKSLQQAGIETAYMNESLRQKDPYLKLAVDLIADGRIEAGFERLSANGSILQIDSESKVEAIASDYMAAKPEQRERTLVLAGTNVERLALTQAIRDKLKHERTLGKTATITQLQTKNLSLVQMRFAHNFEIGDVVMPTRDYKRRGLAKGQLYEVVGQTTDSLTLKSDDGKHLEVDTAFDKAVYQRQEIEIAVGDRLQWKKNDRQLSRRNGQEFVVTAIAADQAYIKYADSDRSESISLAQAQNLDYALVSTTYSSQGKTADRVLISADFTIGQESFYVATSRARHDLYIYTEDPMRLVELAQESKSKENALELLRKQVQESTRQQRQGQQQQPITINIGASVDPPVLKKQTVVNNPVLKTLSPGSQPILKKVTPNISFKHKASIEVPVVKPVLKKVIPDNETIAKVFEKPVLKPAVPTETFWIPQKTEAIPNFIEPKHWQELENSAIHPQIAALNFESLQFSYAGGEHEAWEKLMISDKLNRTNTGRLSKMYIDLYSNLDAGGWWCDAGVDPRTFKDLTPGQKPEKKRWGCYKPDLSRPKTDDGQVIEGKFIKYEHPPKVDLSIFLLDVPQDIADKIYQKAGVQPTESDRKSGFWYCVYKHNLPITITEGAKKAASLLSQSHAAIGLPGIYSGYRTPKDSYGNKIGKSSLHDELAVFATKDRQIDFCFDYETKPETVKNIEISISQTGRLLERQGVKVRVISLPGPDKGVDDFIMAQGPLTYEKVCLEAMRLRNWQRHNQKQRAATIKLPRKLTLKQSSLQQNQTKEPTDDRQQLNSNTVINPEDRGIVNQPGEAERENRAVRNESSRELDRVKSQSLELLEAISRYLEFQEVEQLGADIERINQSITECWFRGERAANNSTVTLRQNSTIVDRTESHGHPEQRDSEQLLNTIADFLETAAIESTNIVKDLQALTENLGYYQNKDSLRAIVLDAASDIAGFIDQSAIETTLVQALLQVTEQLSQYQQQLANEKTPVKQLEHLLTNKPIQNQALGAITEYLESQAVEVSTVELVLSKLAEQLKQLPQPRINSNNQETVNAITEFIEHLAIEPALVKALPSVTEQLSQYQQQLASGRTALNQLEQLLINQQTQNQAVGAIAGYLELQAVEASTVETTLFKLAEQLKQLPQLKITANNHRIDFVVRHSAQDTQQNVDNLLKAISEHVEQDAITTSLAVSALEEIKTQLEQSQSHGTTGLQTLIDKLGYHQSQQLELSMKEILLGLDKQELISLVSKVSDYFEQLYQENDPHLSEMEVIHQLIRDEKVQIVDKLNSFSELELEAEILELSEEIALLEEIELLEAELKSEYRSQNTGFRIN